MAEESFEFQIVNWLAKDIEIDADDEDEENEISKERYVIKVFGTDKEGRSISVSVLNFTPHFYVKINKPWSSFDIRRFQEGVVNHLGYNGNGLRDVKYIQKKDFWGFTNNENFHFLRLTFYNHKTMKFTAKYLSGMVNIPGIYQRKFRIYESNIEPFLRFAHIQNIQPAGWVSILKSKTQPTSVLPSKCSVDIEVGWKNVVAIEKETIAPILIASFDLECMSSDGDFPVPVKNYQKLATNLFNKYRDMKEKNKLDYDIKAEFKTMMLEIFEKRWVIPKETLNVEKLSRTLDMYLDHIVTIIKGDKGVLKKYFLEKIAACFNSQNYNNSGEKCLKFLASIEGNKSLSATQVRKSIHTWLTKCFESSSKILVRNISVEDVVDESIKIVFGDKDGIIRVLTDYLDEFMPCLKGDEIIQIGTTFHRYGESECHRKVIFNLGTCAKIDGIEVMEFENEEDMLLAWTDLINESNPDIITGYNINGFDFHYIYKRSLELGCQPLFCKLGRLIDHTSVYKEAKLSSSALGDNLLKYIDMEGRTIVDLMKVVQRDHKLDSYKLDNVANHFMKMNKNDVSPQDIFRLFRGSAEDRAIIGDYCAQDCALCNKLMMKLEIVANNIGMANVCSVPFSWIFMRGQGVKIFSLVAKECKNNGFLIPVVSKSSMKSEETDTEENSGAGYEGAIVLEPKTGIFIDNPVAIFDYASLYPSSMISENISHDSIVLDDTYDNLPGVKYLNISYDIYEKVGDEKKKIGEEVCRYVQPENGEKGIIPNILMHLLKQRKITRKKIGLKKITFADGESVVGFYAKDDEKVVSIDGAVLRKVEDASEVVRIEDKYNAFEKAVLDGLQLAYKITANSLYGQVGASTSPIYMKTLAASTTATGRKMIMLAKDFMEKEYQAEIVYGDSVTGDTPLLIRYPNGIVDIRTIETLCDEWDDYRALAKKGDMKQQGFIYAQVWSNGNWSNIKRVIRHKTDKQIYRVNTFSGCVDVTQDHSLIGIDGNKICPGELKEGETELKHSFPDEFVEHNIPVRPFNVGDNAWVYDKYDEVYECNKCKEDYDIGMYYMNGVKRETVCKLCVKEQACIRLGKEFDGKIGEKVLKYKVDSYNITKYEAWVWGFFFGDGSCGKYGCDSGLKRSWAINNSNLQFLDKAQKYLENVEDPKIVKFKVLDTLKSSGVYKLVAQGAPKYMVEKYRELFYDKDDYKKVPVIILNAPYEVRLWFFRGYLTADGSKEYMAQGKWDFACKGKIGSQGLYYLMRSLGMKDIRVNIRDDKNNMYRIRNIVDPHRLKRNENKVMKIKKLENTDKTENGENTRFVYDIETEDGVFHGGVGNVLLFNTDSIFCTFPHIYNTASSISREEALQKTYDIAQKASDHIKPLLKKPHDLEYEKIFYPMILFSKKRYCANKYEHDLEKFKQTYMGIALKRRDNANIVKKIYGGIIDIILNKHDIKESIVFLRNSLEDLIKGKYPMEDFIITKTLKGHYKDPKQIAHKVLAERIKERSPGNAPQVNDRIPYAYMEVANDKGLLQGDKIEHPDFIRENKLKVDYLFYITNQIQNPILQLYALILEQLEGYRLPTDHWNKLKASYEKDGKSKKYIDDKITDLREQEARKLLFEDIINKLKLKKTNQSQITDFFK
jgi:DNA polymerase elongation subunit (family B)